MAGQTIIELSEEEQSFVDGLMDTGRFRGVADVVSAGLDLLREREAERRQALERLQAAVQDGLDSGEPEEMESMERIAAGST